MKPLSLLQSLTKESKEASQKKSYQVYIVESSAGTQSVGVPVERVEEFDAFFAESPEKLFDIAEHLERFGSVILG